MEEKRNGCISKWLQSFHFSPPWMIDLVFPFSPIRCVTLNLSSMTVPMCVCVRQSGWVCRTCWKIIWTTEKEGDDTSYQGEVHFFDFVVFHGFTQRFPAYSCLCPQDRSKTNSCKQVLRCACSFWKVWKHNKASSSLLVRLVLPWGATSQSMDGRKLGCPWELSCLCQHCVLHILCTGKHRQA